MIRYNNITLPDMVQRLLKNGLLDTGVTINASVVVHRRSGDGRQFLMLAHYVPSGEKPHVPTQLVYDEVQLERESVSVSDLIARFARAAEGGAFELSAGLSTEITAPPTVELLPSEEPSPGRGARYLIQVRAKETESMPQTGPVMRFGQPSFESLDQAVRFWIPLQLSSQSDGRLGSVVVEVPLAAPRFGTLTAAAGGVIRVTVEQIPVTIVPELTGVWQSGNGHQIEPFSHKVTAGSLDLYRPAWAERVALWLALPDSLVTDYFFESAMTCSRTQRVLFPPDGTTRGEPSSTLAHIHRGEGETVEFKPLINFEPGKFDELVRTVIAFANTHGGAIYLGVNNHQEIIGVERALRAASPQEANRPIEELVQSYCAKARTKICDRVIGNFDFQLEPIRAADTTLIRIVVTEGKEKPYSDFQTKDVWMRRGANTAKPLPAELKQMLGDPVDGGFF